jgi:hypothetical protein
MAELGWCVRFEPSVAEDRHVLNVRRRCVSFWVFLPFPPLAPLVLLQRLLCEDAWTIAAVPRADSMRLTLSQLEDFYSKRGEGALFRVHVLPVHVFDRAFFVPPFCLQVCACALSCACPCVSACTCLCVSACVYPGWKDDTVRVWSACIHPRGSRTGTLFEPAQFSDVGTVVKSGQRRLQQLQELIEIYKWKAEKADGMTSVRSVSALRASV